jgi:phage/plasmid-associated DNA primase
LKAKPNIIMMTTTPTNIMVVTERFDAVVLRSLLASADMERGKKLRPLLLAKEEEAAGGTAGGGGIVDRTIRLGPIRGVCAETPIPRRLVEDAGMPEDFGWGRGYPVVKGETTLASVSREDRSALLRGGEIAWDVDMRSAQPTLLLELLEKYVSDLEFPRLMEYVGDPTAVRRVVLESGYQGIDTLEKAKTAITRIVFGSSQIPALLDTAHVTVDWLRELADDMNIASRVLLSRLPEAKAFKQARDVEHVKRGDTLHTPSSNDDASALSFLLSTCERWCVDVAMKELDEQQSSFKPASYLYDGFLVLRPAGMAVDAPLPEEVLERINAVVRERTGWRRIAFVQKQLATPTETGAGPDMGLIVEELGGYGFTTTGADAFFVKPDRIVVRRATKGEDVYSGFVRRKDMGVVMGVTTTNGSASSSSLAPIGHLAKCFEMQVSLDFLGHPYITPGIKFDMAQYPHDPAHLQFTSSSGKVSVTWNNAFGYGGEERLVVREGDKGSVGRHIKDPKLLTQLHRQVMTVVDRTWERRFNFPVALFNNCTFVTNVTNTTNNIVVADEETALALLSGQDRVGQKTMLEMAMRAQPSLAARFRFDGRTWYEFDANTGCWSEGIVQDAEGALQKAIEPLIQDMAPANRVVWESHSSLEALRKSFAIHVKDKDFAKKLDRVLHLFALGNGDVLDMSTAPPTRRQAKPEDYIRTNTGWAYDADKALAFRADVEEYLQQLLPVAEERDLVLRFIAALLSGHREVKKMMLLTDRRGGNNGKTKFAHFLKQFFGGYFCKGNRLLDQATMKPDANAHDAGLMPFNGKRLTTLDELTNKSTWNDAFLKQLTGGDGEDIRGRAIYGTDFNFAWQCGIIALFNEGRCPQFDITDEPTLQRLLPVPMRAKFVSAEAAASSTAPEYTFPRRADLRDLFENGRSAFLDILVDRYHLKDQIDDSDLPPSVVDLRLELVEGQNPIAEWLDERVEASDDNKDGIPLGELFRYWKEEDVTRSRITQSQHKKLAIPWFTRRRFDVRNGDNSTAINPFKTVVGKTIDHGRNVVLGCRLKALADSGDDA